MEIKAILVDDEPLIRSGLEKTIDWQRFNIRLAGMFANGKAALEYCRQNEVDLIITDIKMPVMDGITLMKECRQEGIEASFVVLSSYSDFEYVREAARIGIENYLLKPVDFLELEQTLSQFSIRMEETLREQQSQLQGERIIRDNLIFRLITGHIREEQVREKAAFIPVPLEQRVYRVAVLKLKSPDGEIPGEEKTERLLHQIERIESAYGVADLVAGTVYVLFWGGREDKKLSEVLSGVLGYAKNVLGITACAAVGSSKGMLEEISISFKEAFRMAVAEFRPGSVLFVEGTDAASEPMAFPFVEREQLELLERKELYADKVRVIDLCREILYLNRFLSADTFSLLAQSIYRRVVRSFRVLGQLSDRQADEWERRYRELFAFSGTEEMMRWVADTVEELYRFVPAMQTGKDPVMEQVLAYLERHYSENINQTILADHFDMSPAVLSRGFRSRTGEGFNAYLNHVRLKKAKELLRSTSLSAKQIAAAVGYNNDKYFNTVFRNEEGVTPHEYRMRGKAENNPEETGD